MTEARALIPEYAPAWTDHNLHDPGVTLVELVAWLSESLLFQLDRVSAEKLRAFLRHVGVTPLPAGVAETVVAFRQGPGSPTAVHLPSRFQVTDSARELVFENSVPLAVSPAWIELDAAEGTDRAVMVREANGARVDVTAANGAADRWFLPFGGSPHSGDALTIGFRDEPLLPGEELNLHVWTTSWVDDHAESTRVAGERAAWKEDCPDALIRGGHYWAETAWDYRAPDDWKPLKVMADETAALSRSGRVVLRGPVVPKTIDGRHWIRCRLAGGGYDCPPTLLLVAANAAVVRHAATAPAETLGESRGVPHEEFDLGARPVVAGTTHVRLSVLGADDDWTEVAEWDRTGPDDPHYRLDPERGTITFGDGRRGRVPTATTTITARAFKVGGGPAGDVPAGRLSRLVGAGALLGVLQPLPACGGMNAEPLTKAHGRALDMLAGPTRGVTAADLERLACETPGVPIGRVRALPGHHPSLGCLPAPGAVTIVVLPRCGDPPVPSVALLQEVRRYLERRRLLGSELHVVGPTYVPVTIEATLHAGPEAPRELVSHAATALDRFLDPLTGGSDGRGWPFGRDVLESEVLAELSRLPGVRFVDGLTISGRKGTAPSCGNLALCPTELPDSLPHAITVKETS